MKRKISFKKSGLMLLGSIFLLSVIASANVFGDTGDTIDVSIYAFTEAPVVDGIIDEQWDVNDYLYIDKIHEEYSIETEFSESDFLPKFKISWFENKLYFLVVVHDDFLFNQNEYAYMNDGFSINLDLGNEKNRELDYNDHNLVAGWGKPETGFVYSGDEDLIGANLIDVVEYAENIDTINGIFVAEIAFNVTDLNMPGMLEEGVVFGLEIEAYDFDGHNSIGTFHRDLTAFWYSTVGNSWFDRSVVGSVGLGAIQLKSAKLTNVDETRKEDLGLLVYPQPAKEMLTIQSDEELSQILIYNFNGKLLHSYDASSVSSTIDISNLSSGYYMITVYSKSGMHGVKSFVVQ